MDFEWWRVKALCQSPKVFQSIAGTLGAEGLTGQGRRLPFSAMFTGVDIGAVRIKQRLHFLAAPEDMNGLSSNGNRCPRARIASGPSFPHFGGRLAVKSLINQKTERFQYPSLTC